MDSSWNNNESEEESEKSLRYFYEEFSAGVRKQLLSKNLLIPQNVYDVLYPQTKEYLVARNVPKQIDLLEDSKSVRDALVAKLVSEQTDLTKISENTRKSLLARNNILKEANDLLNNANVFRDSLLAKNKVSEGDLLGDSSNARNKNISKNEENISASKHIESNNEKFRDKSLAKNTPTENTLDNISEDIRRGNIAKNNTEESDLLRDSKHFLSKNLSANTPETSDLLKDSSEFLDKNISKNIQDTGDILNDSIEYLKNNTAPNKPSDGDLLTDSSEFLKNNTSANVPDSGDLLTDSTGFRKHNTSANMPDASDLLTDSSHTRNALITANKPNDGDLLTDSAQVRTDLLSANKPNDGDLLTDSAQVRTDLLSANTPDAGDLLIDSAPTRTDLLSANTSDSGDLLTDSAQVRTDLLSANTPDAGDLLTDSAQVRTDLLSANTPDAGDLLTDSAQVRTDLLSVNTPDAGDLLTDSAPTRTGLLAVNVPDTGDLLTDSAPTRTGLLAVNVPDTGDLLIDSAPTRTGLLAVNVPDTGDLLTDSAPTLALNLAPNVPDTGDLLIDSAPTLALNLAPNVPDTGDLLIDSAPTLALNLAPNVPDTGDLLIDSAPTLALNLAPNVPDTGDLLIDSAPTLALNLAPNVPDTGDLLIDSQSFLVSNTSFNVPTTGDLLIDSKAYRDNNLSANPPVDPLGVNIEGLGTSAYLGISRVLVQGLLLREVLLARNRPSRYNIDNFFSISELTVMSPFDVRLMLNIGNKYQLGNSGVNEYSEGNVTGLAAPENIVGYYGKNVSDEMYDSFGKSRTYAITYAQDLQNKYGTMNTSDYDFQNRIQASIGEGIFGTSTTSPKGGVFEAPSTPVYKTWLKASEVGSITDAIRNYNLARNLYNTKRIQPGSLESLTALQANNDEGFQDLILQTIGHWSGNEGVGSQRKSNLTPASVIIANNGAYIKGGSPENLLRPEQDQGMEIGTAASMMAQTVPGNSLMDTEFKAGNRGVKHIMRTIRNGEVYTVGFASNYDVQREKKYTIGMNGDGSPKVARQKFTIENPYRPGNAKSVLFYLENFSSGQGFYFPPYIHSYSDSYGANWNEIHFLGRPEPIFTYNNSSREGTISFIVLTDYSQGLTIGTDYNSDSLGPVKINKSIRNFTAKDVAQNKERKLASSEKNAQISETNTGIQQWSQKVKENTNNGNISDAAVSQGNVEEYKKLLNSLEKEKQDLANSLNTSSNYSETNPINGNVNTLLITKRSGDSGDGDIDTKAEDSVKRINEMIKSLAFQPSFFSGDKVDFKTKMDFLAKLTRPAKADQCSGFSFTKPPVCRIRLGDWWNNDIVVTTVNFSYEDSPWTLDDTGVVQPMWATVNMNFKFVGPFGGQSGSPVLSDDVGGFYGPRI